jgi:hypothetical protein
MTRHRLSINEDDLNWWPPHVQITFAAIGRAMDGKRLYPHTLRSIPNAFGSILPGHQVTISHVSGTELGRRKGYYAILVEGPAFGGRWMFFSGRLERLAKAAAKAELSV